MEIENYKPLKELYDSLNQRKRPEDIAHIIMEILEPNLSFFQQRTLKKAVKGSLKSSLLGYSSMMQDFLRPVGCVRQIRKAEELFATTVKLSSAECSDPARVEQFILEVSAEIRKPFGNNDFLHDRLNKVNRKSSGLDVSKRRYNKLFRLLQRLERKLEKFVREIKKYEFTKIGKSSLASKLTWDEFSSNIPSACFIAYLTAKSNLRSEFTISGQQRAYDEIADMLFKICESDKAANWWAIAHVYPNVDVLLKLSERQQGRLLGQWFSILNDVAGLLKETWDASQINRDTMIVCRGNDSSTWNNTANAWNKARSNWIALLHAMKMDAMLDNICPGKVLRLVAGDVAAWHLSAGGGLDPDTKVWNEVPLPWEVVTGARLCTRSMVEDICRKYTVDPIKKGWTAVRPGKYVEAYRPTPELVHGVSVSSPELAGILRKAGWFSGKPISQVDPVVESVDVHYDEHGFVVGAEKSKSDDCQNGRSKKDS